MYLGPNYRNTCPRFPTNSSGRSSQQLLSSQHSLRTAPEGSTESNIWIYLGFIMGSTWLARGLCATELKSEGGGWSGHEIMCLWGDTLMTFLLGVLKSSLQRSELRLGARGGGGRGKSKGSGACGEAGVRNGISGRGRKGMVQKKWVRRA